MASNYHNKTFDDDEEWDMDNNPFMREYYREAAEYDRLLSNLDATGSNAGRHYPLVLELYYPPRTTQELREDIDRVNAESDRLDLLLRRDAVSLQERELLKFLKARNTRQACQLYLDEDRHISLDLSAEFELAMADLEEDDSRHEVPLTTRSEGAVFPQGNVAGPSSAPQYSLSTDLSTLEVEELADEPLTAQEIIDSISRHVGIVDEIKAILRISPHMRDQMLSLMARELRELQRLSRYIASIQPDEEEEVIDDAWMEQLMTRERDAQNASFSSEQSFSRAFSAVAPELVNLELKDEPRTKQEARHEIARHWSKIDKLKQTLRTDSTLQAPVRQFMQYLLFREYREIRRLQVYEDDNDFPPGDPSSSGGDVSWDEFHKWLSSAREVFASFDLAGPIDPTGQPQTSRTEAASSPSAAAQEPPASGLSTDQQPSSSRSEGVYDPTNRRYISIRETPQRQEAEFVLDQPDFINPPVYISDEDIRRSYSTPLPRFEDYLDVLPDLSALGPMTQLPMGYGDRPNAPYGSAAYPRLRTTLRNFPGYPSRIPVHRRHLRARSRIPTRKAKTVKAADVAQVPVVQQPPPSYLGQNRSYDLSLARQREAAARTATEEALMARRRWSQNATRPHSAPQAVFRPPRDPENRSYTLRLARQREAAARAAAQEAADRRWLSRGRRSPPGHFSRPPPWQEGPAVEALLQSQAPVRSPPTLNYAAPDIRPAFGFVYNR